MLTGIRFAFRFLHHLGAAGKQWLSHFCPWLGKSCHSREVSICDVSRRALSKFFVYGRFIFVISQKRDGRTDAIA